MAKKKKPPRPPKVRSVEYHQRRVDDLKYYVERSGLSARAISKTLGFQEIWLYHALTRLTKRPSDQRMSVIIEFLKDYERLQSYYFTLAKMCKPGK